MNVNSFQTFRWISFSYFTDFVSFRWISFSYITDFVSFRWISLSYFTDFVGFCFHFVSFRFFSFLSLPIPRRQKLYFWIFKGTNPDIKTYVAEGLLLTFFLNITNFILGELVSMIASNAVDRELEP